MAGLRNTSGPWFIFSASVFLCHCFFLLKQISLFIFVENTASFINQKTQTYNHSLGSELTTEDKAYNTTFVQAYT
jgi:hypothetical protein